MNAVEGNLIFEHTVRTLTRAHTYQGGNERDRCKNRFPHFCVSPTYLSSPASAVALTRRRCGAYADSCTSCLAGTPGLRLMSMHGFIPVYDLHSKRSLTVLSGGFPWTLSMLSKLSGWRVRFIFLSNTLCRSGHGC